MTEAQKKEFLAVLLKDYGVQVGKEDEILPILHLMYQMVFQYKGIVARQQETIKSFEQLLGETREDLKNSVGRFQPGPGVPIWSGKLKTFGVSLDLRTLVMIFLIVLLLILIGICLIIVRLN